MTPVTYVKKTQQSENGVAAKGIIEEKLPTFLLSIATAGVLGCFGFLWNMNKAITVLQEHDTDNIKARAEQTIRSNNIQLDIRDIRERVIKIEAQNQRK